MGRTFGFQDNFPGKSSPRDTISRNKSAFFHIPERSYFLIVFWKISANYNPRMFRLLFIGTKIGQFKVNLVYSYIW